MSERCTSCGSDDMRHPLNGVFSVDVTVLRCAGCGAIADDTAPPMSPEREAELAQDDADTLAVAGSNND